MRCARIFLRRSTASRIRCKNANTNTQTTFSQTSTSYRPTSLGSRSRHCSPIGCYAFDLSEGKSVTQILNGPSAVSTTLSSLLEYDEEDIDGLPPHAAATAEVKSEVKQEATEVNKELPFAAGGKSVSIGSLLKFMRVRA